MATETGCPLNFRPIAGTCLFRSSQPEDAATSEVFKSAGIKTILDLRDLSEVKGSRNCSDYKQCVVQRVGKTNEETPHVKPMAQGDKGSQRVSPDGLYAGVHAVLSLVNHVTLVRRASLAKMIFIAMAFIFDKIVGTKYSRTLTIKWVLNEPGEESLLWLYQHIIDKEGTGINSALRLLAEPSHTPAVVICSMGKDRTGVTCMFAGHVCGQSERQLCQEYAISDERYSSNPNHFLVKSVENNGLHYTYKFAKYEYMQALIDYVKSKHGSLDAYLDSVGFGPQFREKLRKNISAQ